MSNVLLVTEAGYPWTVGGVSSWIADLTGVVGEEEAAETVRWRFTVVGLRAANDGLLPLPLLLAGTRFIDVALSAQWTPADVVEFTMRALGNEQPAMVHASSSGLAGLIGLALSRALGVPLVVTEHGIAWQEGQTAERPNASVIHFSTADEGSVRAVYDAAARITSVSHANVALQRRFVAKDRAIEVIPNGVLAPNQDAPARTAERPTVVFVGRMSYEKGVDRFIDAVALLAPRHPELAFEIRGPESDSGYADACRERAASRGLLDRLAFTGALPRREAFKGASLLIVPSRMEACPYVVLEAMAAGVPVVAAAVGDCARLLGGSGLVVRGESVTLARAAESLLDADEAREAAKAGGRAVIPFSKRTMRARYDALYASVLREAGRMAA